MNLDPFTGPGSTPSRRTFWDKVTQAVLASQKIAGENVTVDEHQGMGTLINVPNPNRRPIPGGAFSCGVDLPTITISFSGVIDCDGVTGDMNGGFPLTQIITGGSWEGAGAEFFLGESGPFETFISVTCSDEEITIQYADSDTGSIDFFLATGSPPYTSIPNGIVFADCGVRAAYDGTASVTLT